MNPLTIKNKYLYNTVTSARSKVFSFLYHTNTLLGSKNILSVYCYHSFSKDKWSYSVTPTEFKKQIKRLMADGYKFKSLDDIQMHISGEKLLLGKNALITIDDGYESVLDVVNFLTEYSIPAAFFVLGNPEKIDRNETDNTYKLLTFPQIKALSKRGFTIGFHSSTHKDLSILNSSELTIEISQGKKYLEKKLGQKVNHFAYPKGRYNSHVIKHVKNAGFKTAFVMGDSNVTQKHNFFEIPRIGIDKSYSLTDFISLSSPLVITTKLLLHKLYI